MATDWYLMNTDHDTVSGFERDDFDALAPDAFLEALDSRIASNVEICNYDLTERTPIRAIIEGNLQDTRLNALQRKILAPIGTCHAGQYVYYKQRYWLLIGIVDDNSIYEKGVMKLCNYLVTWRNAEGDIVQRWGCAESASQYNNGETTNDRYLQLRSDQIILLVPDDEESVSIPHGKRVILDKRTRYYERRFTADTLCDTSKSLITYNLTRMDNVLFDYQDSGHCQFMVTQDEQHDGDGYYVIDGIGYWLCEEDAPTDRYDETSVLSCRIKCEEPIVYIGLEPTVFRAVFTDQAGHIAGIEPQWSIDCDFHNQLHVEQDGDSIMISVKNRKMLNKRFTLSLTADGYDTTTITVAIAAFI